MRNMAVRKKRFAGAISCGPEGSDETVEDFSFDIEEVCDVRRGEATEQDGALA